MNRRNFLRLSLGGALLTLPLTGYVLRWQQTNMLHPWLQAYEQDINLGFNLSDIKLKDLEALYTGKGDKNSWGRLYESLYTPNFDLIWGVKDIKMGSSKFLFDNALREVKLAK